MLPTNQILLGDALNHLKTLPDESIDLMVTDPPYGYSFMNKDWDKAVVSTEVWKECLRVLKAGAFAFIMSAPRQDVLSRMIVNLQDAGFETNFTSIYWTYASGFPKAASISKLVDKRNGRTPNLYKELGNYLKQKRLESKIPSKELSKLFPSKTGGLTGCLWNWENGENVPTQQQYNILKEKLDLDNRFDELIEREEAEREIISKSNKGAKSIFYNQMKSKEIDITKPATEAAKRLDGSYAGFQPKPALEIIITVMKPLSEKSFVDQALKNGKGVTWLSDCRIPASPITYKPRLNYNQNLNDDEWNKIGQEQETKTTFSRFPANLLVSDEVLNGYSRYFDLDAWYSAQQAQFIITPKASASERNKGLENEEKQQAPEIYCLRQIMSETISIRKNEPNKTLIAEYLKYWREKKGLSHREIDDLMGWNTMYSWLEGRKSGIQLTSPESWLKLKNIIGFDDRYDKIMTETIEVKRKKSDDFEPSKPRGNYHPTVKPIKLFSYLITMGSRENDIILDPFIGSGTTAIAAYQLNRKWIGIEKNPEYYEIAQKRIKPYMIQQKII